MGRSRRGEQLGRYAVTMELEVDGEKRSVVLYNPQPQQDKLHACQKRNILYGGQVGGGKSHGLRWHGIRACLAHRNLKVLLLRRLLTDLEESHLIELQEELEGVPSSVIKYRESKRRLVFPQTGSLVQFGHCRAEKDVAKYLSSQWDMILIDEGTTFTPRMIRRIASRLRTTSDTWTPQLVIGSNPGGDGHVYIKQRYIDKNVPPGEQKRYDPDAHEFIPSALEDNAYLDAEEYEERLAELDEAEYKAYRHGDWDSFAGQFFKGWSPKLHCLDVDQAYALHLLDDDYEVAGCMDWGFSPNPGYIGLAQFDEFGRAIGYKEALLEECSPREAAEIIDSLCVTAKERTCTIVCDTQIQTTQANSKVSIMDEINDRLAELDCGVTLVLANKNRLNGWQRVKQYLKPRHAPALGKALLPWLRFVRPDDESGMGCPYIIATIGAQVYKDDMAGDMKKGPTDHGCDAWRYLLFSREPLTQLPSERKAGPEPHHKRVHTKARKLLQKAMMRQELNADNDGGDLSFDPNDVESAAELEGMFN